jgi:L-cysteine desulfidase
VNLERLFHHILKPALGCTEPVAVALASAAATQAAFGWTPDSAEYQLSSISPESVRTIRVQVSRSVFKNSFAISIPNAAGHKGLLISAALGVFCDPRKSMRLFEDLQPDHVRGAEALAAMNRVRIEIADHAPSEVYIRIEVELEHGTGSCMIRNEHSNLACLWQNGAVVHGNSAIEEAAQEYPEEIEELKALKFGELLGLVNELPETVLAFLKQTVEKNVNACKAGLSRPMGIGTGYFGTGNGEQGDFSRYISSMTAAGSDARMSGHPIEIMTSAGSGNQGIMATIPIVAYAKLRFVDEDRMLRAVALSNLVTMYVTSYVGYLSAFCGVAMKSGIGAACGLTYLMGGQAEDIERAVKIMAATLTGMICDGAKAGCALKVSISADMATRAAVLAMRKAEVPDDNGIVGPTADETIRHLVQLNHSMAAVDQNIIQIMLAKVGS